MNLYRVTYHSWKMDFSGMVRKGMLSIGTSREDAIERVQAIVDKDCREFSASPIEEIMGYKITVTEK